MSTIPIRAMKPVADPLDRLALARRCLALLEQNEHLHQTFLELAGLGYPIEGTPES